MPSQKNIEQLEKIREKLGQAKSLVLADYHGLNVGQMQKLREAVKEAGGELLVAKNTLIKLALDQAQLSVTDTSVLEGPTILLLSYEDEIAPLKALAEFAKENKLPTLKAGFLANEAMDKDKLAQLAELPGKNELLAKLIATINAPRVNLVFALKANLQNLTMVLKAIQKSKGGEDND